MPHNNKPHSPKTPLIIVDTSEFDPFQVSIVFHKNRGLLSHLQKKYSRDIVAFNYLVQSFKGTVKNVCSRTVGHSWPKLLHNASNEDLLKFVESVYEVILKDAPNGTIYLHSIRNVPKNGRLPCNTELLSDTVVRGNWDKPSV